MRGDNNMALFDKKYCDICGGSMGLIIDNKAADGNFCHSCSNKLSPFFHGARNSTLQQIQQQPDVAGAAAV